MVDMEPHAGEILHEGREHIRLTEGFFENHFIA